MTSRLSLFLDVSTEIGVVKGAITEVLGHSFSVIESDMGTIYATTAFCIEWRLFEDHGLEDDCGIAFSQYRYQLMLTPLRHGAAESFFEAMYNSCAAFMAATISTSLACRTLIVANLQRQVAAFVHIA